jgi:hypothetical protein
MNSTSSNKMLDDYELMQCVDAGLDKFGRGIKYTVYWRMVVLNESPSEGIISNPKGFVTALKSIFGNSAKQIEQAIIDEIKSHIGENSTHVETDSLPELLSHVRREKLLVQSVH